MFKKLCYLIIVSLFPIFIAGCGKEPAYVEPAVNYNYQTGKQAFHNRDYKTALAHMIKYAESGDAYAQYILGYIYNDVSGKFLYPKESFFWYSKSARQGNKSAQNNVGRFYWQGVAGIKKDYAKAFMWLRIATLNGSKTAPKNMDKLTQFLSPSEIQDSIKKADMCLNSGYKECD